MRSQENPIGGRQSGQAMVEAALTLPLVIFLILGTLQLFLLLQARIMTQYAVFRATRAGSVSHGDCGRMMDAAIGALLPTFARTDSPDRLADAFKQFKNNHYDGRLKGGSAGKAFTGEVVWLLRESPTNVTASEEDSFDQGGGPRRLEVRMVFWYPLRIPFADWVMTKMFRAHFAIEEFHNANPLILTKKDAGWNEGAGNLDALIRGAYADRTAQGSGGYVFPIVASYTMRMMTPPKTENFAQQNCAPN